MADKLTDPFGTERAKKRQEGFERLLEPFPPEQIGKLPRVTCRACRESQNKRCDNPKHTWVFSCPECKGSHTSAAIHLDYVGHADITRRLLEVDPEWNWEPKAVDAQGFPARDSDQGMWIYLTVLGVTRLGYGDAQGKRGPNAVKETIGDALRNAAMRFGVGLDLWSKSDRVDASTDTGQDTPRPATPQPIPPKPDYDAQTAADTAAGFPGNAAKLRELWHEANDAGALGVKITRPDGAKQPLGVYIVELGTMPKPDSTDETVEPDPCPNTRQSDGKPCLRFKDHPGRHDYGETDPKAAAAAEQPK